MSSVDEKARALIHESPYKVLVTDSAGQLDLLASLVATLESTRAHAEKNSLGVIRRWDVSEGVAQPVENEPEYQVEVKRRKGHVDVLVAPPDVVSDDARPQLCLSLMVDAGLPTVLITSNSCTGAVKQVVQGLPFDSLGIRLADEGGLPDLMLKIDPAGRHLRGTPLPDIDSVIHSLRQLDALESQIKIDVLAHR